MTNQRYMSSWVLALLLPVTFGLGCGVVRDWSVCVPEDGVRGCLPGYVCTADLRCVLPGDGGMDALVRVDSQASTDTIGVSVDLATPTVSDGPAGPGPDASVVPPPAVDAAPDAPASTAPDAPSSAGPPDAPPASGSSDAPVGGGADAPATSVAPDAPVGGVGDAPIGDAPSGVQPADAAGTCSTDKDCSPQSPLCLNNRCAKCSTDSDCKGRSGTPACAASGLCVACTANGHCTGAAGTCDTATNQCVGCLRRSDCAGACLTCSSGACVAVKSQDDPGFCAGTCDSTGVCKSKQGQTCQTVAGGCAAGTACSSDGVCCDNICDQPCHSCLASKTGGTDGTCASVNAGTACGSGQVCSGGNCQTGCWIGGSFVGGGATNASNTCQICNPAKSTTGWSNNDAETAVPCGSCGGTAACSNMVLGNCSKNTATYYRDNDGDGYGDPGIQPVLACSAPTGWVSQAGDCDDADRQDYPGATECDAFDQSSLTTCASSGSLVSSACPNGCAGGQCRTFPFPTINVAGSVTCGTLQCPTSQGCSFGGGWTGRPVCGTPFKYYHATCDGQNDCPAGQVCCWTYAGGSDGGVACFPSGTCPNFQMGSNAYLVCDPNQAGSCPAGSTCTMLSTYSTYYCRPD